MEPQRSSPSPVYAIGGRRFTLDTPGFVQAIADAHAAHLRPRCLCRRDAQVLGVEMYVARLAGSAGGFIVKRMPDTGSQHAPDCPSYEPPADCSGLAQVLGSAIREDPATGKTLLRLDFPLTSMAGRCGQPGSTGHEADSVASHGTRLTLRGLLHYLWDQAELTRWHPGFAGKRSWAMVRRHLLQAAERKIVGGEALRERLYIPEAFTVEEREALNARRLAQWRQATNQPGEPQRLMLLIGELKEIVPARFGHRAVVKHLPDQAFAVDELLYRRMARRFAAELALWGAADDVHLVVMGSFAVGSGGVPALQELCLIPVTRQWLPVEDGYEKQLIDRLVAEGRSFVKGLRYNAPAMSTIASAVLTDCEEGAPMLFVLGHGNNDEAQELRDAEAAPNWRWHPQVETMPALPTRRSSREREVDAANG